jgi:hypothetical protein
MRVIHSLIAPPRPPAPATMGPPLRRRATVTAALLALVLVAEEVTGRIGAAGRDCVALQRDSIVAFQSRTGVEVGAFASDIVRLFLVLQVFDGITTCL